MGLLDRLQSAYKSLRFPAPAPPNVVSVFSTEADFDRAVNQLLLGFRGTERNYAAAVGDLTLSSLMMAAVTAVGNSASEAELQVREQQGNEEVLVDNHPLVKLWYRPNPFYDAPTMIKAVSTSWVIADNAYIRKERNEQGRVIELWYEPHNTIRAVYPQDGSEFISRYEVQRGPDWVPIPVTDVIHFRNGLDPANPRYGLSSTPAIFREIFGDNESANWYANLMANDAGFRYFLSIDNKAGELGQEDIENIKKLLVAQITGDKKFTPPVITNAEPKKLQFSPQELDLRLQRYLAEERFCAVKGIPGTVMEFGSAGEHCLPADTRISTVDRGPVPIADVQVGDLVWAFDPDGTLAKRPVTWSGRTGSKQLFKIKTRNRTIWASGNHPFLVRRKEKVEAPRINHRHSPEWRYWLEWVPLENLKVGDRILEVLALPDTGKTYLPDGTPATAQLMQWLGAFIGDGSYLSNGKPKGVSLSIPACDRVGTQYRELTKWVFTKKEDVHIVAGLKNQSIPYSITEGKNCFTVQSPRLSGFVEGLGFGRGARNKRIPEWVFGLNDTLRLAFMCGLLDTDGSVSKRGHAVWRLASKQLTYDLWHLALGLGMKVSNVYHLQQPRSCLPNEGKQEFYDAWQFTIMSADDVRRIGSSDPLYNKYLAATNEKKRTNRASRGDHVLPDLTATVAVQSIEAGPEEDVYDLTVDVAHNFIADGLIVKNSIYNNVFQGQQRFTNNYLAPFWKHITETLTHSLLPEFDNNPSHYVFYDTSDVKALQEDENTRHKRIDGDYEAGIITRAEARRAIGLDATDSDNVYFVPRGGATQAMTAVPPKDAAAPPVTEKTQSQPTATQPTSGAKPNGALAPSQMVQ